MKKGFTFIELMIVMAILAILAGIITGNVINSLKKGRDTERKADLHQIQNALELYYHDHRAYPTPQSPPGLSFGTGGLEDGTTIYMKELPNDPNNTYRYYYTGSSEGSFYSLYSIVENGQDEGKGVSQSGYAGTDCGNGGTGIECKYGVASPNITLAPTSAP